MKPKEKNQPEQLGPSSVPHEGPQKGILRVFQSKAETRAYYNALSRFYDLLAERSEEPARQAGLDILAAKPGETLLEVGFGTGHCLVDLARAVGPRGKIYGIELSDGMLRRSQSLLEAEGLLDRVQLILDDAERLPYPSASMDGIFMSFTLELCDTPDIPNLLGECLRVLRPGGRLVVVGMSKEGEPGMAVRAFEWTHRHFPIVLDCRPIFVRRALDEAGFSIDAYQLVHVWVPVEIVRGTKEDPAPRQTVRENDTFSEECPAR